MKRIPMVTTVLAVAVIGTIIAVAQIGHMGGPQHDFAGFANHHEKMIEHMADKLKFTDQQKAQAKQLVADAKTRFGPVQDRLKESHRSTTDLGTNGVFDEQKAQEVATRQAEIIKQALAEKERTKAALFAIMTAEQRVQAKEMMSHLTENFGH